MADALTTLTYFVIVIIVGILISIFSKKIKISNILLLILTGLILGAVTRRTGIYDASADSNVLIVLAIFALVMIIFDGSSKFNVKELNNFSVSALKLTGMFMILNVVLLGTVLCGLFFGSFSITNLLYAIVFAIIISGTDPSSVFSMLKSKSNKILDFLEVEAILNTPLMVILPFILLDIISQLGGQVVVNWQAYFTAILSQILVGLGSGIFVGIIFFKAMKKYYSESISPLATITSALLAYILAENLNGNGVLAVAVLGFVFGHVYVANKSVLQEFSTMVSNSLEILVFVILGFIVQLNIDLIFILKSLVIFALMIISRYLATKISLGAEYSEKEKWFIALNMPKGIAVAVIVFSLSVLGIAELFTINNLVILVMIYSLVTATIVNKFSKKFIKININE